MSPEGFVVCSLFRKWPLVGWQDVSEFRVARVPSLGTKIVVYDWNRAPKPGLRRMNRALVGAGEGLPDPYGRNAEELAVLLNLWRTAHVVR
jgi:hypothetical protein